ncbi:MAG: hypothetical protein QG577_1363 [Thermodesulfobacteriota bacterium]|nr:hypothetical protein [Thermodesulfobacteriota bacterium]
MTLSFPNCSDKKTYSFGKNWQTFLKSYDEERLRHAALSLRDFLGISDLKNMSFLDIGCGSGLFSYAAHHLGASRVVSFDIDPFSVECCLYLHRMSGSPSTWTVREGSILDKELMHGLGKFDVVYSWGVLHHTGRMWDAIANSVDMVTPSGYLYIALYNKILARHGKASWIHDFWLRVKKSYNRHPWLGAYVLEPAAMAAYLAMVIARGENPYSHVKNYKSHRGMSWRTDATDWLAGYPYEFATVEEVFLFVRSCAPDLELINIKVTGGRGLNWFLFKKKAADNG